MTQKHLEIISFGGGVQTVALAILTVQGRIHPPAEAAVFADTQGEHPATYAYLDMFQPWIEERGLPLIRVTAGSLLNFCLEKRFIPVTYGSANGAGRRQCTDKYKIRPIRRWLRKQVGRRGRAIVQLGISMDESERLHDSGLKWVQNRYPLIELRMTRKDCLRIIRQAGLPDPPKSACFFCPLQNRHRWAMLASERPDLFEIACRMEELACRRRQEIGKSPIYLTGAGRPLRQLFSSDQLLLFPDPYESEECSGYCFV